MVEKPGKKKVSSVRFITLNLSDQEQKNYKFIVKDSLERVYAGREIVVRDLVRGTEESLVTSETGLLEFSLKGSGYYRLYYHNRQYYYDSLSKVGTGYLRFGK